jgi:uracil-DNA glycosylase
MDLTNLKLPDDWKLLLGDEFEKPYMQDLKDKLMLERSSGQVIYPKGSEIFNAFNLIPLHKLKVVILGQDPYHGAGQAHGLSFSVPPNMKPPPSLQNIFKEIHEDLGCSIPATGDLSSWARQGVLLLNAVLTVRANSPASHSGYGWEKFTDAVISKLSASKDHLVFMLWGKFAQGKKNLIDTSRHLVLEAAHPSPFSAYNGFMGCRHFSKANQWLAQNGIREINWSLE